MAFPWQLPFGWMFHQIFRLKEDRKAVLEEPAYTIKAGTLVKVVMVSRFGDVGITDDLTKEYGYKTRVSLSLLEEVAGATYNMKVEMSDWMKDLYMVDGPVKQQPLQVVQELCARWAEALCEK